MNVKPLNANEVHALLDDAPALVYISDRDGRLLYVNTAVEQLLCHSRDHLLGRGYAAFMSQDVADQIRANDGIVMDQHRPMVFEEHYRVHGEIRTYLSLKFPLWDEAGSITGLYGVCTEITHSSVHHLTGVNEDFHEIVEHSLVGVYIIEQGRFRYVNPRLAQIFGYSRAQLQGNCRVLDLVAPGDRDRVIANIDSRLREEVDSLHYTFEGLHRDGRRLQVEVLGSRTTHRGKPAIIGTLVDVTQRRALERDYRLSARALEHTSEGVLILDDTLRVEAANEAACKLTGRDRTQVIGTRAQQLMPEPDDRERLSALLAALRTSGHATAELYGRRQAGERSPIWVTADVVPDTDDDTRHYILIVKDISQYRAYEERLKHLANHDRLTDLPNRTLFHSLMEEWLAKSTRDGTGCALLFIDLDGFKTINDSLGHSVGDTMLRSVAERLHGLVRGSDVMARLGGDEFALLIPGIEDAETAGTRARAVLDAFTSPFEHEGHELFTSASVGICLFPQDGRTPEALLSNADAAMYRAKESGRNNYCFYQQRMNQQARRNLFLANQLRLALERDEFRLAYQPFISLANNRVTAGEALLRWQSQAEGLIMPGDFIPLAERTGMIGEIGDWVFNEACRQVAQWRKQGLDHIRVAVNLSIRQLQDPALAARVEDTLRRHGVPAQSMELEITETAMMEEPERVRLVCGELAELGVELSIDDFGTGYSSLSYLKNFPVNRLKLDGSFVRGLPHDKGDAAITSAVIGLAASLNLGLVAECIETAAQRDFLAAQGCQEGQGYFFARPLPPEDFKKRAQK